MKETIPAAPDQKPADEWATAGFAALDREKVIEKNENSVILEFSISGSSPYYDGHFPEFPLLPAVAQTELVVRFASRYLGTGIGVSQIPRIKFTNMVRPFIPLVLKLEKKGKTVSFRMTSPNAETVYSSGTLETQEICCSPGSGSPVLNEVQQERL